jgi:small nuclear ribonucleoprotein E
MNLVIDDAVEVAQITKTNDKESRRPLGAYSDLSRSRLKLIPRSWLTQYTGQILLKGDNVSLIQNMSG